MRYVPSASVSSKSTYHPDAPSYRQGRTGTTVCEIMSSQAPEATAADGQAEHYPSCDMILTVDRHKKYLDPELQQRAMEYDGLSKDAQVGRRNVLPLPHWEKRKSLLIRRLAQREVRCDPPACVYIWSVIHAVAAALAQAQVPAHLAAAAARGAEPEPRVFERRP